MAMRYSVRRSMPSDFRRPGPVAADGLQDVQQISPLELVERWADRVNSCVLQRVARRRHDRRRQIVNIDRSPAAEDDQTLDRVLELADVARPVVGRQGRDRIRRRSSRPARCARRRWLQELLDQQRDVVAPLAQRRQPDDDHAEPIERS